MLIDVRKPVMTTESGHESLPSEQDEPKGAFDSAQVFSYIREALESSEVHEAGAERHFWNVRSHIEEMLEEALFEESVLLLQTRPSLEGVDDILDERFRTLISVLRERLGKESSQRLSKIAAIPHPSKSETWHADRKAINKQHIAVVSAYIGLENVCYDLASFPKRGEEIRMPQSLLTQENPSAAVAELRVLVKSHAIFGTRSGKVERPTQGWYNRLSEVVKAFREIEDLKQCLYDFSPQGLDLFFSNVLARFST